MTVISALLRPEAAKDPVEGGVTGGGVEPEHCGRVLLVSQYLHVSLILVVERE